MHLFYRKFGETGNQPLIILHGIFGSSDNWATYGRRIAQEGFEVFIPDQRNHGQSPHNNIFNYLALTDDLFDFIDDNNIYNPIILGHSMGGKVAMRFALENPQLVKRLVIVDISLKAYGPRPQHKKIIEAMKSVDLDMVSSRAEVDEQLSSLIPQVPVRQFILKNLHRKEHDEYEWRMFLEGIDKNLDSMFDAIETGSRFMKPTLFIKGGDSDYILMEDYGPIRNNFPNAEIVTIADTTHWLHVEAPEKFYQLTMGFVTGSPSWYVESDGITRIEHN